MASQVNPRGNMQTEESQNEFHQFTQDEYTRMQNAFVKLQSSVEKALSDIDALTKTVDILGHTIESQQMIIEELVVTQTATGNLVNDTRQELNL